MPGVVGQVASGDMYRVALFLPDQSLAALVDLVGSLDSALDSSSERPWALVGGLAVQAWAPYARVTRDVDLDTADRDEAVAVVRGAFPSATATRNGLKIGSEKVDFLGVVDPVEFGRELGHEVNLIWFEALRLRVPRLVSTSSGVLSVPIARPGLLLAMKLSAINASVRSRSLVQRDEEKWPSDITDAEILVRTLGARHLIQDIRLADPLVAEYTAQWATEWWLDQALELSRRTRAASDRSISELSAPTIESTGREILAALNRA